MSKQRIIGAFRRENETLTREIDQVLLGVSPDQLGQADDLEDQELLELAYRLADAQLAERSHIREPLRDRLVSQIEDRQEMNRKMERERVVKKQPRIWRIILIGVAILMLMALIFGAAAVLFVNSQPPPPESVVMMAEVDYDEAAPPVMQGYKVFPVYDVSGITFGDVLRLEQMVVRNEQYSSSPDVDSIILIWEAIGPVPPGQYAVVVEMIDLQSGQMSTEETVEVSLPTETGTSLATEHDIPGYNSYATYHLSVFDRVNNTRLLMQNGAEYLELRAVPSSIVPSVLGAPGEMPTVAPMPTPTIKP